MTKSRRFYIAVEVGLFRHPKAKRVGEKLVYRHLMAMAWCHEYRTDGYLPRADALDIVYSQKAADALVAADLWHVSEQPCKDCVRRRQEEKSVPAPSGGWLIHDYLEHQESKASLERASEAGRKGAAARHGGVR